MNAIVVQLLKDVYEKKYYWVDSDSVYSGCINICDQGKSRAYVGGEQIREDDGRSFSRRDDSASYCRGEWVAFDDLYDTADQALEVLRAKLEKKYIRDEKSVQPKEKKVEKDSPKSRWGKRT